MGEYRIEMTPEAEADIDEAYSYISCQLENPQAAFELTDGIYDGIGKLSAMPSRFPVWRREPLKSEGVRFFGVKNFNVFYVIDATRRTVFVLRVMYSRRDV
ncbi:MAG: type II toxin-antitoxin system RelE/ParE family toxin [Kiritimatiellia bacterium]